MLKKEMKKIFQNLYIFSKFTLSFILLACLVGTLYLLYSNYQKEDNIYQNQISFEKDLSESIKKNTELIGKISQEIKTNELMMDEITKNISSLKIQENVKDIPIINKNIELLNNNVDILSKEIQNLKNENFSLLSEEENELDIISKTKKDIIELILVKYENNIVFNRELFYLRDIVSDKNITNIEKISILSRSPYKGHEYLKDIFDQEVNIYLKDFINNDYNSFFSKIILPYINISPTSENEVTSDLILKIKQIKLDIGNKNIENALKNLKTINEYENIFKLSSLEINKYLNFKMELYKLI